MQDKRWLVGTIAIILSLGHTACTAPPFYSYLIYENPTSFVRLEVAPWADSNIPHTWNSHPATLSRYQVSQALRGLQVREHRPGPLKWIRGEAQPEPVFREEEIEFLAPKLQEGLDLAVPQEVVTFYLSHPLNATRREVTSGGVFVIGGNLHVILSNHRTMYAIPPAGLIHDRRYPLLALAPSDVDLGFESSDMVVPKEEALFDSLLGDERAGEIVLDLSRLAMMKM